MFIKNNNNNILKGFDDSQFIPSAEISNEHLFAALAQENCDWQCL